MNCFSPLLFSLFLNDLEEYLTNCCCSPLNVQLSPDGDMFVRLLYADDTIMLCETREGLQKVLDNLNDHCHKWKLSVNSEKTKVVIFGRGRLTAKDAFNTIWRRTFCT